LQTRIPFAEIPNKDHQLLTLSNDSVYVRLGLRKLKFLAQDNLVGFGSINNGWFHADADVNERF